MAHVTSMTWPNTGQIYRGHFAYNTNSESLGDIYIKAKEVKEDVLHHQLQECNPEAARMNESGRRIIFLAGAPLSSSLDWSDDALSASLLPCFTNDHGFHRQPSLSLEPRPAWRSLPFEQHHLPTGLTQNLIVNEQVNNDKSEANLLALENTPLASSLLSCSLGRGYLQLSQISQYTPEDTTSQFYEHSFAVHEEIPSSQVIGPSQDAETSFFSDITDCSIISSDDADLNSTDQLPQARPTFGHLSNLKDIPSGVYLRFIEPQTMTVNLVVGIISVPQSRCITTRKGGRTVELIEMLVGDDTSAGFGVNLWLPSMESLIVVENNLRSQVARLRPQDVVLMKNVALSSFRGRVYGQSLRKDVTTIDLLYRKTVGFEGNRGIYSIQELDKADPRDLHMYKLKKVNQWVMAFVGTAVNLLLPDGAQKTIRDQRGAEATHLVALPPDTQPNI